MRCFLFDAGIPLLAVGANVVVQMCLARFRLAGGLLKSEYCGAAAGLLFLGGLQYLSASYIVTSGHSVPAAVCANAAAYICLAYCYFHFVNLGETARRIRILRELYEAKRELTYQEILLRYNAAEIVDRRMKRLLSTGQIYRTDGILYSRVSPMVHAARIICFLKRLLLPR